MAAVQVETEDVLGLLETLVVGDVMTRSVLSVRAATSIRDAARLMHERKLGALPVVEGERLIGLLTETDVLPDDKAAAAEELILAGHDTCKTWADLLRLVQRAVCTVDPDGATRRREEAERESARARFWRESSGACALAGHALPADQALAAWGTKFSLRRFHEALLALGAPPLGTMGDALVA